MARTLGVVLRSPGPGGCLSWWDSARQISFLADLLHGLSQIVVCGLVISWLTCVPRNNWLWSVPGPQMLTGKPASCELNMNREVSSSSRTKDSLGHAEPEKGVNVIDAQHVTWSMLQIWAWLEFASCIFFCCNEQPRLPKDKQCLETVWDSNFRGWRPRPEG